LPRPLIVERGPYSLFHAPESALGERLGFVHHPGGDVFDRDLEATRIGSSVLIAVRGLAISKNAKPLHAHPKSIELTQLPLFHWSNLFLMCDQQAGHRHFARELCS
jgi:hypothetical protein